MAGLTGRPVCMTVGRTAVPTVVLMAVPMAGRMAGRTVVLMAVPTVGGWRCRQLMLVGDHQEAAGAADAPQAGRPLPQQESTQQESAQQESAQQESDDTAGPKTDAESMHRRPDG